MIIKMPDGTTYHFFVFKHLFNHLVMFADIFILHKWKHICHLGSYLAFERWINDVNGSPTFTEERKNNISYTFLMNAP